MTWTKLLADKDAQKHKTSKKELDSMRALIARDLADAQKMAPMALFAVGTMARLVARTCCAAPICSQRPVRIPERSGRG